MGDALQCDGIDCLMDGLYSRLSKAFALGVEVDESCIVVSQLRLEASTLVER